MSAWAFLLTVCKCGKGKGLRWRLDDLARPGHALWENLTDDAIAWLHVTKFSTISLYLTKLEYISHRALKCRQQSSTAKSAQTLLTVCKTLQIPRLISSGIFNAQLFFSWMEIIRMYILFIRERVKKPRPSSFAIIVHESYPILTPYIDEKAFSNMFSILLKCLLRNST